MQTTSPSVQNGHAVASPNMIDQIARFAGLVGMVLPPKNGGAGAQGPAGPRGKPGTQGPQGVQGPPGVYVPSFGIAEMLPADFGFLGCQDCVLVSSGTAARFWNPRGTMSLQCTGVRVSFRAATYELPPASLGMQVNIYAWDDATSIFTPPTSTASAVASPVLVGPRLAIAETYDLNLVGGGNIELGHMRRVAVQCGALDAPLSTDEVDYVVEFLFASVAVPGPVRPLLPLP